MKVYKIPFVEKKDEKFAGGDNIIIVTLYEDYLDLKRNYTIEYYDEEKGYKEEQDRIGIVRVLKKTIEILEYYYSPAHECWGLELSFNKTGSVILYFKEKKEVEKYFNLTWDWMYREMKNPLTHDVVSQKGETV